MKKVLILGSTGSIGTQTLDVIRQNPDYFKVVGLVCGSNVGLLEKQIEEFKPKYVGAYKKGEGERGKGKVKQYFGEEGILEIIATADYDLVVVAISGAAGLKPAFAAIRRGRDVALATKEVMVLAGELVNQELKKHKVNLFPIDSEHSAIWQSLRSGQNKEIEKIILTCSGGPFKNKKRQDLVEVTVEQALGHPTWKMGRKITIDSATLMNKGLEVIEAKWLFNVEVNQIEVVIHPQSILHSAVTFHDGSTIGQMGLPDMRTPIQYALSYPKRLRNNFPRMSLPEIIQLDFSKPDLKTFPCLQLAYDALKSGGTMTTVLNAVDEVAVAAFLDQKIKFLEIPEIINTVMRKHKLIKKPSLENIVDADQWARKKAQECISNLGRQ